MKRDREQETNRVYVVFFGMDLPDCVGSFLFTDEEVAVLQRFQMSVPSEREAAVANGSAEVLRKIFDYTMGRRRSGGGRHVRTRSKSHQKQGGLSSVDEGAWSDAAVSWDRINKGKSKRKL